MSDDATTPPDHDATGVGVLDAAERRTFIDLLGRVVARGKANRPVERD